MASCCLIAGFILPYADDRCFFFHFALPLCLTRRSRACHLTLLSCKYVLSISILRNSSNCLCFFFSFVLLLNGFSINSCWEYRSKCESNENSCANIVTYGYDISERVFVFLFHTKRIQKINMCMACLKCRPLIFSWGIDEWMGSSFSLKKNDFVIFKWMTHSERRKTVHDTFLFWHIASATKQPNPQTTHIDNVTLWMPKKMLNTWNYVIWNRAMWLLFSTQYGLIFLFRMILTVCSSAIIFLANARIISLLASSEFRLTFTSTDYRWCFLV